MITNTLYSKNNPPAQPRAAQVSVPPYGPVLCQTTLYGQDGQVLCQTTLYGQALGKTQPPAAQPPAAHPPAAQPPAAQPPAAHPPAAQPLFATQPRAPLRAPLRAQTQAQPLLPQPPTKDSHLNQSQVNIKNSPIISSSTATLDVPVMKPALTKEVKNEEFLKRFKRFYQDNSTLTSDKLLSKLSNESKKLDPDDECRLSLLKKAVTMGLINKGNVSKLCRIDNYFYTGECKNDKLEGYGVVIYENGDIYAGELKNNKRHGKGKMIYADDNIYNGEWENGKIKGYGVAFFTDGNIYDGEWKNGKQNGKGKMIYADGDSDEGEWENGKLVKGKVKLTFSDGASYTGEWRNNGKEGLGTFICKRGVFYDGTFKNGFATDFSKIILTDSNNKPHTITKKGELYFYQGEGGVEEEQEEEKGIEIDIENEKRLKSALLQFGNTHSNQEGTKEMKDHGKLGEFITSEIANSYNEAKFYVITIPGHAFIMVFENGKALCLDNGGLNNVSLTDWRVVIDENHVKYVNLPHEPNLKFHLKDGKLIDIPIENIHCCRHGANALFQKLIELENKLKELKNELKEKKLSDGLEENESLIDKLLEYLQEVSGKKGELLMRINSHVTYTPTGYRHYKYNSSPIRIKRNT